MEKERELFYEHPDAEFEELALYSLLCQSPGAGQGESGGDNDF